MNNEIEPLPLEGSSGHFFSMMAPQLKSQGIEALLPSNVSFDAFVRAAATAMAQNPELANADQKSVIQSLIRCATHGLVPDSREAALVTFKEKQGNNYIMKAQYIPMVDGVLKRARMSGQVAVIAAKAVFDGDTFDYWMDEQGEHINYRPTFKGRGEFSLAFAFAKLHTGELIVEVMPKDDIERVRSASKTGNSEYSPWAKWYDRMAVKSVLHRLARRLPSASELVTLLESGDEFDYSRQQEKSVTQASGNRTLDAMRKKQRPVTIEAEPLQQAEQHIETVDQIDHSGAYADHCAAIEGSSSKDEWHKAYTSAWEWANETGDQSIIAGIKQIAGECKRKFDQPQA
ncbi:recombinase RecT [Aeromonas veronii]|uniref:recombinase RecT n=1 Tax=Aeromonas TaxID=642 RepID=UPI002444AF4D|nr:recombinase RecT [Aeromonas veronii]